MSAYTPTSWATLGVVAAILVFEVVAGYVLSRYGSQTRWGRMLAILLTIGLPIAIERLTATEPAGVRMVVLVLSLLYGMKAVVGVESGAQLNGGRWLGFCVLWFGMRPAIFARAGEKRHPGASNLVYRGLIHGAIGFGFLVIARVAWDLRSSIDPEVARWIATVPLLAGLSLMLHFGLFNLLAGLWRRLGVDARPLFREPLWATNLNEFWSKRWNLAFSEMTALAIFRPASGTVGRRGALVLAFIVSGLLHEAAISVPVQAGFGGPSLYFLLHGLLVAFESWCERRDRPIRSRAWVWVTLALPVPILFHRPFLAGVVWPLIGID